MEIITILISIIALIVAVAGYYYNLKSANQNRIFEEKIQAYSKIATAIDNAVIALSDGIAEGRYLRKEKPKGYIQELDALADNIDQTTNEMFDLLMANIILLPKRIYNHLDELATFIDSDENYNIFERPMKIDPLLTELRKRQTAAIKMMRDDLQADRLNTGLSKRLSRRSLGHKIFGEE